MYLCSLFVCAMKYGNYILLAVLLLIATAAGADRLTDILDGNYNARTLSEQEVDSILNGVGKARYRLEYENKQSLFRRSFLADYYLVDTQKGTRVRLSDTPIRDPQIAPNEEYVVYGKADGNLYINKLRFEGVEVPITRDGSAQVFNGIADWLYEEEFGATSLFAFSPDSKMVAFVRLDETKVPAFEWQTFLTEGVYPQLDSLRYPKAGEQNAKAAVCVYDIYHKSIQTMQLPEMKDAYIPRICWTKGGTPAKGKEVSTPDLAILRLNRDQNKMEVLLGNPKSTITHRFYQEESNRYYVDYALFDAWQWLHDNRVVVLSEKGGYTQAYMYSAQGVEQKCLTPESRDITALYGYDEVTQTLYYQAATSPEERQCFAVNCKKGITTPLTQGAGVHSLTFSDDWKRYIACYQSVTTPDVYTLHTIGKAAAEVLLTNDSVARAWLATGLPEMEFFTFTTERGDVLHGWMLLPQHREAGKQYPVVMFQYSGPASQRVLNRWRKRFEYYLPEQGYIVVCVDGRGTDARGRAFRNATYMQLGVKEAEDQMSAARYLQTLPYVDGKRIAIVGWSYGGFEAIMCMSNQPAVQSGQSPLFKCGVAIAPVTSWRLYDSAYTERYMRRPQVNESGYDSSDLMKRAADLQGKLLLVHGLADDNVHVQNTFLYTEALVQAGKQFEMQIYTDDNHFLRKRSNYEHMHRRILLFLAENL